MKTLILAATATLFGAGAGFAATLGGSTGYALSAGGTQLTVFGDLSDTAATKTISLSGSVDAVAYRPVTGELYGYAAADGEGADVVYVIDTATGQLTSAGAAFDEGAFITDGAAMGFDFNNQIDAARAVSTAEDNLVFFPDTFPNAANAGSVKRFTDLFYAAGDVNEGMDPAIFANAYTNALDGMTASATVQFALDAGANTLVNLANNAGTLTTVAEITLGGSVLDFTTAGGFDIVSMAEGDNLAIALLTLTSGNAGLYTIDLSTGYATLVGDLGYGDFSGFAAQNTVAAIPLPASALLLLGALGGLAAVRRRLND